MNTVLALTKQLINIPSISPEDKGCLDIIIARLEKLGFTTELFHSGGATNLWARRGSAKPVVCFAGHTDVVPPGPITQWHSDPFTASERDGLLFGRGSADMKSAVAAMVIAIENFIADNPNHPGSIALLLTSAEEEFHQHGTPIVIDALEKRGEKIDYCIVGEPSSSQQLGDTLKIGRRGSLNATLTIHGTQGHIAYPHLANNPIHQAMPALAQLCTTHWDDGTKQFQATQFQISNIHAGTGATNVIPANIVVSFNFRYAPCTNAENLQLAVEEILQQHDLRYDLDWQLSGEPFYSNDAQFIQLCQDVIAENTGITPELSTGGGTSDGRFIAPTGTQVIEFGVINETIHQANESVNIADLQTLASIYQQILSKSLNI